MKNHYVDLSDIKDNDMDKTASFTDLMSRSEKLEHKRLKEEEKTRELKEILMNEDDKKKLMKEERKRKKNEKKNAKEVFKLEQKDEKTINKNIDEINNNELSKTQRLMDMTNEIKLSMINNTSNNINNNKILGIGGIIVNDILIIISLVYYIYSILFTNIQNNQVYLLIGGIIILAMIIFFCISIIANKTLSKIFTILNYFIFICYIFFNLILVIGIIEL